jgi:hypothetical protein
MKPVRLSPSLRIASTVCLSFLVLTSVACGEVSPEEAEDVGVLEGELGRISPVPGHALGMAYGVKGSSWALGYHTGDDYPAAQGAKVVATHDGRIVAAGWNIAGPAYGLQVLMQSGSIQHLYAHLSSINVHAGEQVLRGDRLGAVGETGNANGTHLHYEERVSPYHYGDDRKPAFSRPWNTPGYMHWRYGTHHAVIVGLQRALVSAGCLVGGNLSDFYDDTTKAGVACKQRKLGFSRSDADGIVGITSLKGLYLVGDVVVANLHVGVKDADSVRRLQQRLNEVMGKNHPISGNYFESTRLLARSWQLSIGDSGTGADGNIGPIQARILFPGDRYNLL